MEYLILSHLVLMTQIPHGVQLFGMAITLFIPTIHRILPLIQGILHMNHGGKTFI
jgi:hypothetical protein